MMKRLGMVVLFWLLLAPNALAQEPTNCQWIKPISGSTEWPTDMSPAYDGDLNTAWTIGGPDWTVTTTFNLNDSYNVCDIQVFFDGNQIISNIAVNGVDTDVFNQCYPGNSVSFRTYAKGNIMDIREIDFYVCDLPQQPTPTPIQPLENNVLCYGDTYWSFRNGFEALVFYIENFAASAEAWIDLSGVDVAIYIINAISSVIGWILVLNNLTVAFSSLLLIVFLYFSILSIKGIVSLLKWIKGMIFAS